MLLLKATERNWGLMGPGDWDRHSWKINEDGWYEYKETYRSNAPDELPEIPDVVVEGQMEEEELAKLKEAIDCPWPETTAGASDGTAWEFKMYGNGMVIRHRELGSISGIETYEAIIAALPAAE